MRLEGDIMKKSSLIIVLAITFTIFLSSCSKQDNQCQPCPQYTPPVEGWCSDGVIQSAKTDECGCTGHPSCMQKNFCTTENFEECPEEGQVVCGWFNTNIKCIKYPCAQNFANSCLACQDDKVAHWTEGECPK
jgi:hypothetical protein